MVTARPFFIVAGLCIVLNIVLVLLPSDTLNALGGLSLIVAVVLIVCGAYIRRRTRNGKTPG